MKTRSTQKKFIGTPTTKAYRPTRGNCSGILSSIKNRAARPWRGLLERDAMMLWELDPEVESYHVEPVKVQYVMPSGRKSHYTPDRLVHFNGNRPSLLLEIKPARNLRKKRAIWKAKFAAARSEAQKRGWEFDVWTEKHIRGPQLENAVFLRDFAIRPADEIAQKRILTILFQKGPMTGDVLLSALTSEPDERLHLIPQMWQMIALRTIDTSWDEIITLKSKLSCLREVQE